MLKVNKKELLEGLKIVSGYIEKKCTLPIISNTLLKADKSGLTLSANNLTSAIRLSMKARVEKEMAVVVNPKVLAAAIDFSSTEEVSLTSGDGWLNVGGSTSLPIIPPEEFPEIPKVEGKLHPFPTSAFTGFWFVVPAVSKKEERYVLNGIYFHQNYVAATDGYRLHLYKGNQPICDNPLVIPAAFLKLFLKKIDSPVTFRTNEEHAEFHSSYHSFDIIAVTRLLPAQYPDWKQVMPKEVKSTVIADRKELLDAFSQTIKQIKARQLCNTAIHVAYKDNALSLIPDLSGEGKLEIKIQTRSAGESPPSFAVDGRYMCDALKSFEAKEIALYLNDTPGPIALQEVLKNKDKMAIVMPIRTAEPSEPEEEPIEEPVEGEPVEETAEESEVIEI